MNNGTHDLAMKVLSQRTIELRNLRDALLRDADDQATRSAASRRALKGAATRISGQISRIEISLAFLLASQQAER